MLGYARGRRCPKSARVLGSFESPASTARPRLRLWFCAHHASSLVHLFDVSALRLRGEPGRPERREGRSGGRQVRKDPQDPLVRRAGAERLFALWTVNVVRSALLHVQRMSGSSALTPLIQEAPSRLIQITAKLLSGHSGKASQLKSSSHAFRGDHLQYKIE
jgi:hypothetical protein